MKMNKEHSSDRDNVDEIDLIQIVLMLFSHKYKIIITTVLFAVLTFLYTATKQPTYIASVLIQLDKNPNNNLISKLMSPLGNDEPSSATEMGILKSRRVLSMTIEEMGLQLVVREKRLPYIGDFLAAFSSKKPPTIIVPTFSVPPESEDMDWELTVLSPDSYQLNLGENGIFLGKVNQTLNQSGFIINVANITAPAGTKFTLTIYSKFTVIQDLLKRLTAEELNKTSGLIHVSLTGDNKQKITQILNNISLNFREDNMTQRAEEASKSLDFVNKLLPVAQESLNRADKQLNVFKQENGSIDLPLEAKAVLESSVTIQSQQNELQLAKAELSKLYTKSHPIYRALLEKEALINEEKVALSQAISTMPKKQQEILSIKRDVEAGQEIYMQLLAKQHEFGIAKASTVANIRIVDEAISDPKPVGKLKGVSAVLGAFLGFIFSSGYCLIASLFRRLLEDTQSIENYGVEVLASVPWSKRPQSQTFRKFKTKPIRKDFWLAREHPDDLAIEAMRSLRTAIFIALKQADKNSFLISGATPGAGKTFICGNLAAVMADTGKRILLIDADMRLGYLHEMLGLKEQYGLSEILQNNIEFKDAVQPSTQSGLDFISRGAGAVLSSELLMHDNFAQLMQWAQREYDYVIVDTPPILSITDAAIAAQHIGLSLLVLRYKINTVKELVTAINRFKKCHVELDYVVFNGVQKGAISAYEYPYYSQSV
ncbi:tyrosine-protein kinase [Buttiauxella ferragutiae ATCC 51602]|uniref:Tyrosine-protein kinase n=1 Tax=Buttiauxella ferragutiae ATCC 51602 TaxID=1354252 RepID=A0ABX2WD27_9ENTR|nr:polysaccharide biosynthesis tyrosine autokinase [Buttiauxella ferragutiae]MCE0827804.1 polysaccharide biosynthesis tyrosine autokinase [Buttiauxella ferragutiae]OAT31669.1 tyrosine-protein kinase [Buttiauxella ferragutiae ATCC 51602]